MTVSRIRGIAKLLEQVRHLDSTNEAFEVEAEDDVPFVQLGHWVALSGVSAGALALYWMLAMHLNHARGDRYVWPTTAVLAHMLGYSRGDKIKRFVDELVAIGAIRVITVPDLRGPQKRNVYRLRRNPPEGYAGPVSLGAFYKKLDEAYEQETAGEPVCPETGAHVTPETGGDVGPQTGGHVGPRAGAVTTRTPNYMNGKDAPSARSAADGRRPSTSGSRERASSGFAAAGKEGSSSDQENGTADLPGQRQPEQPNLSREQMAAVRAVEAVLPPVLLAKLPYQQFPKRNRPAVLQALESRTVEQLADRVQRRWVAYGYEPALYDGSLTQPVGAALELIVPPRYCPDPSCEDGVMIHTGMECRACLERLASRRAARAAGLEVKTGSSKGVGGGRMPECVICQAPFPGVVPDGGECLRCQKEAEAAVAALSARLGSSDASWEAPQAQFTGWSGAEPGGHVVDEDTARLRAFYARQFGTPEQVEAYCTEAPF